MSLPLTTASRSVAEATELILAYPLDFVRTSLLEKSKLQPAVAEEAIAEFRKYLCLIAMGYGELGMVSTEVDEVWHAFILFTREYATFCDRAFGRFLHHEPSIEQGSLDGALSRRFFHAYRKEFGQPTPIWTLSQSGEAKCVASPCKSEDY